MSDRPEEITELSSIADRLVASDDIDMQRIGMILLATIAAGEIDCLQILFYEVDKFMGWCRANDLFRQDEP